MKRTIVHLLPWTLTTGGAQRFCLTLARWAAREGAEVHVVHPEGADPAWAEAFTDSGVTLHPAQSSDAARRIVAQIGPDLVHHHWPMSGWGLEKEGLVGFSASEKPDLSPFSKPALIGTPHSWSQNLDPGLPAWAIRIAGPNAAIRHGVDLEKFAPAKYPLTGVRGSDIPSVGAANDSARVNPEQPFRIGIVGRLHADKIPAPFLKALASWQSGGSPDLHLYFIGAGLDHPITRRTRAALEAFPFCHVLGDVPAGQMPDAYRFLDALLIPSSMDSVSFAAIEALASGLPVIARRTQGLPDTIGDAGILCDNDEQLLAACEWLRSSPDQCAALSRLARARAEAMFDERRMLAQYGEAYAAALAGRAEKEGLVGFSASEKPDLSPFSGGKKAGCPDISVLMPVGPSLAPEWFAQAVTSVAAQRGVRFEFVIVLDGPLHENLEYVADTAAEHCRARVIRLPEHRGISAALNAGLRMCRTSLVARMDADDIMPEERLFEQVRAMRDHPKAAMICGLMERLNLDGSRSMMMHNPYRPGVPLWSYWRRAWPINHPTVCFRREAVLALGGYDEALPVAEDLDLWCRMEAAGLTIRKYGRVWNVYRTHPGMLTAGTDGGKYAELVLAKYRGEPCTLT